MIRILTVLAVLTWANGAQADSAEDKLAATNKLAEIRTAEPYCPDLKVNEAMAAEAVAKYGIDLNSIEAKIQAAKKLAMAQRSVKKAGAKAWCAALEFMYGAKGIAGKNMLLRK
ncbi:MAG: hypothetical protein C0605_15305 [Hyphomicrobiales bacterium]|nr:MAG: hypothetical protein C0605_15305 [Hyphomicrobiales bacterium]